MSVWSSGQEPVGVADRSVTLVEGSSFCICDAGGDIGGAGPRGVFFRDTRIVSHLELTVDGERPDPLAQLTPEPYRGVFVARVARRGGRTDHNLLVERQRWVGNGIREDVTIDNPGPEPAACAVSVVVAADFADLFEVKEGRVVPRGELRCRVEGDRLVLEHLWRDTRRAPVVQAPGGSLVPPMSHEQGGGAVRYDVVVPPRGRWTTSLEIWPVVEGEDLEPSFPVGQPVQESLPARRLHSWQVSTPVATEGPAHLRQVLQRSQQDLGALRIFDRDDPDRVAVAAGAPWFMALFGRDSLLTAYMSLALDPGLAAGTLTTLASHQGKRVDPLTEEEPGRILHEVRLGVESGLSLGGGSIYYGTVDATPLFVVLLAELQRWKPDDDLVARLLPAADRALAWIDDCGDRDGDGFVEYQRATDRGLRNQGWKDSWDGVTWADGRIADTPIALCEVQGYVYDAYRSRAELARQLDDEETAERWLARARELKRAFNERFWLPERGWFALALDRDKRPVDACASNMGHCLWSGIVDDELAGAVAERLLSPEMFTGWGVRTLAADMAAYDPVSYHNGSVWPHDNALIVTGLMRYGFVDEAQRVAQGLFEAAEAFGGRLPELFAGLDRSAYTAPVPYPTSCSPQAWASATPIQLTRSLLRFEPWLTRDAVWVAPALPPGFAGLRVEGIALGRDHVSLAVDQDGAATLDGLPPNIEVHHEPFNWSR
jgi:glycogen debranching enzyme